MDEAITNPLESLIQIRLETQCGYPVGDDYSQLLVLSRDGTVVVTRYGQEGDILESEWFRIDPDTAGHILQKVREHFSKPFDLMRVNSAGLWRLTVTEADGTEHKYECSLSEEMSGLSNLIRYWLDIDDLMLFDGAPTSDNVTRLVLSYRWTAGAQGAEPLFTLFEALSIDGETETIRHVWKPMNGIEVTREYRIEGSVSEFLETIDSSMFYEPIPGDPEDAIPDPANVSEYELAVSFKRSVPLYIKGSYDRDGLPRKWSDFMGKLLEFLHFYGDSDIFDPHIYESRKRRADDLIFLSVEFEEGGYTYYYLTEDDTIRPGDRVIVPVGPTWTEKAVRVVKKEYYSRENVPMPLEKVKPVLRRAE